MDNQHRKIKGYRELSQEEIDLMNQIKEQGAKIGDLIDKLEEYNADMSSDCSYPHERDVFDEAAEWVVIGKRQIQQGLMALTRAVAKPNFF